MKRRFLLLFALTVVISSLVSCKKEDDEPIELSVTTSAGGLSNAIGSSKLDNVWKLTVSGTIDSRDFKVMCDQMPILTTIDLSNTTITAFDNNEANAIPKEAFFYSYYKHGFDKSPLTTILLPSTITTIDYESFYCCENLKSIEIPSSVTNINSRAFERCISLKEIYIPRSVSTIESKAFAQFEGLINVDPSNNYFSSEEGILYNKSKTKVIQSPISKTVLIIPNSVDTIGDYAFYFCKIQSIELPSSLTIVGEGAFDACQYLDSIILPSTITFIGAYAFHTCSEITEINIPNSINYISSQTFSSCSKLEKISIPESVKGIGNGAFEYCNSLTSISIPSSVYYFGFSIFDECKSLKSIKLNNPIPSYSIYSDTFLGVNKNTCTLYVPTGSKATYQATAIWRDFTNIVEF